MAKKVTISVPDELYEKMTKWKSSFNFSRVCQNALYGIINKKEALSSKVRNEMDLSAIVERLKKEKNDYEFNIAEWGKKDGMEWCKTAHYAELRYALAWVSFNKADTDEELGVYFSSMMRKYKKQIATTGQKAQDCLNSFAEKYATGWKEGVELFWNEIKDRI